MFPHVRTKLKPVSYFAQRLYPFLKEHLFAQTQKFSDEFSEISALIARGGRLHVGRSERRLRLGRWLVRLSLRGDRSAPHDVAAADLERSRLVDAALERLLLADATVDRLLREDRAVDALRHAHEHRSRGAIDEGGRERVPRAHTGVKEAYHSGRWHADGGGQLQGKRHIVLRGLAPTFLLVRRICIWSDASLMSHVEMVRTSRMGF